MQVFHEQLNTAVLGEYDIIVAGGGVAGVCAAVAARRAGIKRVLLLEKDILFGGLATQGLISLYEPICDGKGHKIIYGMGAELMKLCKTETLCIFNHHDCSIRHVNTDFNNGS